MKILFYCQHVLGVGHFFRALALCRALSPHPVTLVTGGREVEADLPQNVRVEPLPPLFMDREFSGLFAESGEDLEETRKQRSERLLQILETTRPDVFLSELFPFGRKAFSFELIPLLDKIRQKRGRKVKTAVSLRDILVEKEDPRAYEERVTGLVNRYFDLVLVHSDPMVAHLSETFSRARDLRARVVHTGYVAREANAFSREKIRASHGVSANEPWIVASSGSGAVGENLLSAVLAAHREMPAPPALSVFTGPHLSDASFEALCALSGKNARVDRFSPNFQQVLNSADLSVSMAGYNTCMDLLSTEVPTLVLPFSQNREQPLRAARLSRLADFSVLARDDLEPQRLAGILEARLSAGPGCKKSFVDLSGAQKTARILEEWV